jgi:hypothetical protein
MSTTGINRTVNLNRVLPVMVAFVIVISLTIMPGFVPKAHSNKGAAFLGGMVAGHIIGGAVQRDKAKTQAAEYQAYSQPHAVSQAAPAAKPTAEQRIQQLDKLAAGGYITPAEYKAKKKSILDSM